MPPMKKKEIPPVGMPELQKEVEQTQEAVLAEKLKVAEVLLGGENFNIENLYADSKGNKGKALNQEKALTTTQEVESSFSPEAIEQAKVVISAREENARVLEQSYELKKKSPEPKKVKIAEINATEQKNAKEKHEEAIIELKKILTRDEIVKLRTKYGDAKYGGGPAFDKIAKEKLIDGVDGNGGHP